MSMGRKKGFVVSEESKSKTAVGVRAFWVSPAGFVLKEKLRARLKAKWVEQKAGVKE